VRVNVDNAGIIGPYACLSLTRFTVGFPFVEVDSRTVPEMGFMLPDSPEKHTGGERWV